MKLIEIVSFALRPTLGGPAGIAKAVRAADRSEALRDRWVATGCPNGANVPWSEIDGAICLGPSDAAGAVFELVAT